MANVIRFVQASYFSQATVFLHECSERPQSFERRETLHGRVVNSCSLSKLLSSASLLRCFVWAAAVAAFLLAGDAARLLAGPASSSHARVNAVSFGQSPVSHLPAILGPGCPEVPPLAKEMLALINRDRLAPAYWRETQGLARPLRWDPRLAAIAFQHSEDMVREHFFSHVDPDGDTPVERFYKAGIQWRSMGENIAINSSVPLAQAGLMNEPPFQPNHRGNILNRKFDCIGVGVRRAPDGRVYVTQDFADEE